MKYIGIKVNGCLNCKKEKCLGCAINFYLFVYLFVSATFLPKDRLSQVTKRGMLKSPSKLPAASHSKEQHDWYQRKTEVNRSSSEGTAVRTGILREQTRPKEREEMAQSGFDRLQEELQSNIVRTSLFATYFPDAVDGKSTLSHSYDHSVLELKTVIAN